jgi:hypothetical protein
MTSIRLLHPPDYTVEECQALIDFVLALKKTQIQDFLQRVELPKSGTKSDLRERLQEALDEGDLEYGQVVEFLDSVVPWGKQHVFLYRGPQRDLQLWKEPKRLRQYLDQHNVGRFFNARLPLILPERLRLSSITHSDGSVRVAAVQKQEYTERIKEHDEQRETPDGMLITLRAYAHHISRMFVTFEWDLTSNVAMLQISQLHRDRLYEEVAEEFSALVEPWLDIGRFALGSV